MKIKLIYIHCVIRRETEKAIAVADGTEEDGREKWCWLSKNFVEINDYGTVTLPESIAVAKGLI